METHVKIELGKNNNVEIMGDFTEALTLITVMMNKHPLLKKLFQEAINADDAFKKHQNDIQNQSKNN